MVFYFTALFLLEEPRQQAPGRFDGSDNVRGAHAVNSSKGYKIPAALVIKLCTRRLTRPPTGWRRGWGSRSPPRTSSSALCPGHTAAACPAWSADRGTCRPATSGSDFHSENQIAKINCGTSFSPFGLNLVCTEQWKWINEPALMSADLWLKSLRLLVETLMMPLLHFILTIINRWYSVQTQGQQITEYASDNPFRKVMTIKD